MLKPRGVWLRAQHAIGVTTPGPVATQPMERLHPAQVHLSSASFSAGNWSIAVKGARSPCTKSPPSPSPAFTHRAASRVGAPTKATIGPAHRLDIGFSAKGDFAARSRPHGVSVIPVCTHPIGGSDAQGRLSLVLGIFGQSFSSPIPRYGEHHV